MSMLRENEINSKLEEDQFKKNNLNNTQLKNAKSVWKEKYAKTSKCVVVTNKSKLKQIILNKFLWKCKIFSWFNPEVPNHPTCKQNNFWLVKTFTKAYTSRNKM